MKKWFTLIELVVAIIIISFVFVGIVTLARVASDFTNKARAEIVGINLAREWMEAIYTHRNSNRLSSSTDASERDSKRLCIDKDCTHKFGGAINPWQPSWKNPGIFKLNYTSGSTSFTLITGSSQQNLDNAINFDVSIPTLKLENEDYLNPDVKQVWTFYRAILDLGVYSKDSSTRWWDLVNENTATTWPREFRFCSKVSYDSAWPLGKWNITLCWAITNYIDDVE